MVQKFSMAEFVPIAGLEVNAFKAFPASVTGLRLFVAGISQ